MVGHYSRPGHHHHPVCSGCHSHCTAHSPHLLLVQEEQEESVRSTRFYYPPLVFNPYRDIYGAGHTLFLYNGAFVPWITTVINFLYIKSQKLGYPQIYVIYYWEGHFTALLLMYVT